MTHAIEIITPDQRGALNIHGIDDENKALLGFLARYHGVTLANYEYDLRTFRQWTVNMGLLRILDAERFHLELYVRDLTGAGLAPATISRRFSTVRCFYHFAHVDGLIRKDPAAYVKTPKIEHDQQHRTWFETVDMAIVLRKTTDIRERAILQVMFDLALRVAELCSLDVESIERASNGVFLRFVGKGSKLAVMQIPFPSLAAIDAYLDGRSTGPLFLNAWGNRITRPNVSALIDRCAKAAGIDYHVSPHGVRRTHARAVVQQGGTIEDAAENLRHKDSRVTRQSYAIDTGAADLGRLKLSAAMANLTRKG